MVFNLVTQVNPQNTNLTQAGQSNLSGLTDLESPTFTYDLLQYPLTENPDYPNNGHNIIFYINIPQLSAWNTGPQQGPGPVANRGNVNATQFGLRAPGAGDTNADGTGGNGLLGAVTNAVLSDKTVRTTSAISLYIPPTMVFGHHLNWENVSLTSALGVFGDIGALAGLLEQGHWGAAGAAAASIIPDVTKRLGSLFGFKGGVGAVDRNAALAAAGIADNPQNFLLFKQIDFRKFQFDFILTPETPQEASIINQIIYLFRFNSVPEVLTGSVGRYFVPPSEFDIDIIHNGQRNINIPLISTCVLNSINVDYAAAGQWSTTYDGVPQQIRMTLDFTEKVILTKDLVQSGF
jgi:hypothetical protein